MNKTTTTTKTTTKTTAPTYHCKEDILKLKDSYKTTSISSEDKKILTKALDNIYITCINETVEKFFKNIKSSSEKEIISNKIKEKNLKLQEKFIKDKLNNAQQRGVFVKSSIDDFLMGNNWNPREIINEIINEGDTEKNNNKKTILGVISEIYDVLNVCNLNNGNFQIDEKGNGICRLWENEKKIALNHLMLPVYKFCSKYQGTFLIESNSCLLKNGTIIPSVLIDTVDITSPFIKKMTSGLDLDIAFLSDKNLSLKQKDKHINKQSKNILNYVELEKKLKGEGETSLTKEECLGVTGKSNGIDHAKHFSKTRDQGSLGTCWAFAGTALMEEYLCLKMPEYCGKELSVVDFSRGHSSGIVTDGGSESSVFSFHREKENGICLEKDAPYVPQCDFMELGAVSKFFAGFLSTEECLRKKLIAFYKEHQKEVNDIQRKILLCNENALSKSDKIIILNEEIDQLTNYTFKALNKLVGGNNFKFNIEAIKNAIKSGASTNEFIQKLFIPPSCVKNRIDEFKDVQFFTSTVEEIPKISIFSMIQTVLASGRSVSISVCAKYFSTPFSRAKPLTEIPQFLNQDNKEECGNHAVVIQGLQWDSKNKKCNFIIRNSWGKLENYLSRNYRDSLSGNTSVERVLKSMYEFTSIFPSEK
ncbi:MAG: hypothetical protein HQK49_00170 [Oligoflexia bacterium]|nr:hypothetical protein [Oligoflexia bacterium]